MEPHYDLIENSQTRCACALVLDTSDSMTGAPINELNEGVAQLLAELMEDDIAKYSVELGIFTFGGEVRQEMEFSALENTHGIWQDKKFAAAGNTPMGGAVNAAAEALERRKREYKEAGVSYYQPWLILMTDGLPTDNYQEAARKLRAAAEDKKVVVFGVGVRECNMQVLAEFCPANRPPKKLDGVKFREFFAWLSQSMSRVSQSSPGDKINMPSTDGWESIEG